MERIVVCMKWGAAFGSRDVNMLLRACREHCREPLRFICLTDDATGLAESVEAWTIPDIGLTDEEWSRPGVWPKLSLFSNELAKLGRILFLDLDMMVVGDLSPFFEPTEGVVFQNMGDSGYFSFKVFLCQRDFPTAQEMHVYPNNPQRKLGYIDNFGN